MAFSFRSGPVDFNSGEAIVAATAWTILNALKPIAPQLDHAGVAEIVNERQGRLELLTAGQWNM